MACFVVSGPAPFYDENRRAEAIRHSGIRVGAIVAYRAWRVIEKTWCPIDEERLHSVAMWEHAWCPDKPASGAVRTHGLYSFRNPLQSVHEHGVPVVRM